MNFRRGRARDEPEINLIPLIDILIVILIFLFLTTTYSRYAELQINLPQAAADRAQDKPSMLNVAVDSSGKYAINGDAAATHQSVINVMESARLAGYNHISFTTQTRR